MPRPFDSRNLTDNRPNHPMAAAVDYLDAIERETTLLKSILQNMHSVTPAIRGQIEASTDYIDRYLRAIKAGYLYQSDTTRKT